MALLKTIPTQYGIDATYWRITNINSFFNGKTSVMIDGYLDKDARFESAEPLRREVRDFPLQDVTRAIAYAEFKKLDMFTGALDD